AAFALAAPLVRVAEWLLVPAWREHLIGHSFETVGDAIAAGCVLAGIRGWLWRRPGYRAFLASPWFLAVPMAVVAAGSFDEARVKLPLGMTIMNAGIALIIERCVRFPGD